MNLQSNMTEDDKHEVIDNINVDVKNVKMTDEPESNVNVKADNDEKNQAETEEKEKIQPDQSNLPVLLAENEEERYSRSPKRVFEGGGRRKSKNKQEKNPKSVKTIIEIFEKMQRGKENCDENAMKFRFQNLMFSSNSDSTLTDKADRLRKTEGGKLTEAIFTVKIKPTPAHQ